MDSRLRWARRGLTVLVAAATLAGPAAAHAGLIDVKPRPGVTPAYVVQADAHSKRGAIEVRMLRLRGTGAGVVKYRCAGACRRSPGPSPRISHPHATTVINHLNLIFARTTVLSLSVIVPGGQSHF